MATGRIVEVVCVYSNHAVPEVSQLLAGGNSASDLREQARVDKLEELAADHQPDRHPPRLTTKVTESLRREVRARYGAGESSRRIAEDLGIAKSTVLSILGDDVRPTNKILSDEQVAAARRLRDAGWLYREIGEKFGVHEDTVRRRVLGS